MSEETNPAERHNDEDATQLIFPKGYILYIIYIITIIYKINISSRLLNRFI